MRLKRRLTVRRPLRRSSPPTAVGGFFAVPASDPRPAFWSMRCMCGTLFEITQEDYGKRQTCGTCRRRFSIGFTKDATTGQIGVSLHFLANESDDSDETNVGHETTSYQVAVSASRTNLPEPLQEPELPDEAHFKCSSCQVQLAIARTQYEQRTRCPACGTRMLVFLLYNSNSNSHVIQVFRLTDRSSGRTQVLSKL